MALVSKTRDKQAVPHEPGEWIEFRPLSGPALEEAREVKVKAGLAMVAGFDPATLRAATENRQADNRQRSVWDLYDHDTLLRHCIVAWSYSDMVEVDDLDARTRNWAVGYILDANGLTETEADRKNG